MILVEYLIRLAAIYLAAFLADRGEKIGGFSGKIAGCCSMMIIIQSCLTGHEPVFFMPENAGFCWISPPKRRKLPRRGVKSATHSRP